LQEVVLVEEDSFLETPMEVPVVVLVVIEHHLVPLEQTHLPKASLFILVEMYLLLLGLVEQDLQTEVQADLIQFLAQ
jgi:hypothetical protein